MFLYRSLAATAFVTHLSLAAADTNSTCYSNGVDFLDEEHYFINTLSLESFTVVSTFHGCNTGMADVLLVDIAGGNEFLCSQVPTVPEDTPELSTCPILKSQMTTGDWIIEVLGNNGDGNPFAWERDISIDAGPQATATYTATVTYNITTTPVITSTLTSTATVVSSTGPFTTVTIPSSTANQTKTVTPQPVTTTTTKTFTRHRTNWTKELSITTKTVQATCTTASTTRQDKPATYTPTLLSLPTTETAAATAAYHRYVRKAPRAVDSDYARRRVEAVRRKQSLQAREEAAPLVRRAPDVPTITLTAAIPANATITYTAAPITTTESVLQTTTSISTLPPATIFSGVYTQTTTLPTPTNTRSVFIYTTSVTTKTIHATFTRTTTVIPSASVTACREQGGYMEQGTY